MHRMYVCMCYQSSVCGCAGLQQPHCELVGDLLVLQGVDQPHGTEHTDRP